MDPLRYMSQIQTDGPGGPRSERCRHWDRCARSAHTRAQIDLHSYMAGLKRARELHHGHWPWPNPPLSGTHHAHNHMAILGQHGIRNCHIQRHTHRLLIWPGFRMSRDLKGHHLEDTFLYFIDYQLVKGSRCWCQRQKPL